MSEASYKLLYEEQLALSNLIIRRYDAAKEAACRLRFKLDWVLGDEQPTRKQADEWVENQIEHLIRKQ